MFVFLHLGISSTCPVSAGHRGSSRKCRIIYGSDVSIQKICNSGTDCFHPYPTPSPFLTSERRSCQALLPGYVRKLCRSRFAVISNVRPVVRERIGCRPFVDVHYPHAMPHLGSVPGRSRRKEREDKFHLIASRLL